MTGERHHGLNPPFFIYGTPLIPVLISTRPTSVLLITPRDHRLRSVAFPLAGNIALRACPQWDIAGKNTPTATSFRDESVDVRSSRIKEPQIQLFWDLWCKGDLPLGESLQLFKGG